MVYTHALIALAKGTVPALRENYVGLVSLPDSKIRQKLSEEDDIKLAGYTYRLKITSESPLRHLNFVELTSPLQGYTFYLADTTFW